MLVRIRSREGNFRFELDAQDDISGLISKILETSKDIDPATLCLSNQPRGGENNVGTITGNLGTLGITHGDLLFASYKLLEVNATEPEVINTATTLSGIKVAIEKPLSDIPSAVKIENTGGKKLWELAAANEEEVDKHWETKDGKIPRKKGMGGCQCGPKSMCDYCMPLEPFDPGYQAEAAIKHLSYHAYLRKTNASAPLSAQSTSYIPPLADPSYNVQVPCTSNSHPSWPAGICTKCQPSAVTLSRQTYRMVDHIEFAQSELVNGLLTFWRKTGSQRFGYLLGRYEPYEKVPMGIKAVVEAIHEPPQDPLADGVTVGFPWMEQARVERLAEACGLKVVGMIYTDLTADTSTDEAKKSGKVVQKRHANSYFLSSLEVIFSATLQRAYPNTSKFSATGKFSSKFVTCVLTGDADGGIAVEAYQVSDQAMSMVEADMIEASVDPSVVRVKEELPTRYIPDVFYRYKNKYGIDVKESAKPCFPVEYLLVNVSHGFPTEPHPLFTTPTPFNIENRSGVEEQSLSLVASKFADLLKRVPAHLLGLDASVDAFGSSISKGKGREEDGDALREIGKWFSDWHLLSFLDSIGIFDSNDIKLITHAAVSREIECLPILFETGSWKTFLTLTKDEAPSLPARDYPGSNGQAGQMLDDGFEIPPDVDQPPAPINNNDDFDMAGAEDNAGGGGGGMLVCPHCTYENEPGAMDCDVCGLPCA